MIFESIEHAMHYAAGNKLEIVLYGNKVVDVTDFKQKHPGGLDSINKHIGKNITEAFDKVSSHQTKTAHKDVDEFCIGTIKLDKEHKPIISEDNFTYDVDLKKGILYQVFTKLNKEQYLHFIHDPKHMINPPEAILFETNFLEYFTKTPWFIIPILWIPLIMYNLSEGYKALNLPIPEIVLWYFFGIFMWTLTEYILHRFFFHLDERLPNNSYALMLHFLFHGIHHAFPMDK